MQKFRTPSGKFLTSSQTRISIALFIGLTAFFVLTMANINKGGRSSLFTAAAAEESQLSGEWTAEIDRSKPAEIHMTFHRRSEKGGFSMSGDTIALNEMKGLTAEIAFSPKTRVTFSLVREAGTFACEGFFNQGRGAGFWTFTPNQSFVSAMNGRGYSNLTEDNVLWAAWNNLTTKFIEDLKSAGYDQLKFEELLRAASHEITPEFIREMRSAGFDKLSMEQLIRARNHDITSQYVSEVRSMGFDKQSLESLIRFRNHDITKEFIAQMGSAGFKELSIEQLIRLKNHDITAEFINGIKAEGFSDISPDTAIRLKNSEVDQAFIKRVKARGLTNLTPEQLIRLRNQDIVK